jgi:hypothetical protein
MRRRLVRLARAAARVFDGPQDIEWAIDRDGQLVLLQARPITTLGDEARPEGPILGPGPVAETFPAPLSPLEEELWIPPLREGLRRALALSGAVSARRLRSSRVVVTVDGHPAADLDLLGLAPGRVRCGGGSTRARRPAGSAPHGGWGGCGRHSPGSPPTSSPRSTRTWPRFPLSRPWHPTSSRGCSSGRPAS